MLDRTPVLPADRETVEKLVPQTLTLGNSGKTTVLNLLGIHLERVFGEAETLLDESSKLTDPTTLLTQDFLGMGSTDNNLTNRDMLRSPSSSHSTGTRLTSVRAWVTRTSQPEYPSSESSRVKKSLSSARKTPSATNFFRLLIWADILERAGNVVVDEPDRYQSLGGLGTVRKRMRLYSIFRQLGKFHSASGYYVMSCAATCPLLPHRTPP